MAQYQSFPDAEGDSRTVEKLRALKLPDLEGRRFLDVGCNEGFFCGFAKFAGATRVVGIDHSRLFIDRARHRFPDCEFLHQRWDRLPKGPFDVILLASALHYAEDQPVLIRRLVERLSGDGVLVLEMGIAPSREKAWVEVERGIDRRSFPTMTMLEEVLEEFAWKWMGPSVPQDGDPVPRHVVHVSRRRPLAYLLMQPPAFGKTTIAKRLFVPAGVPIVSGDQVIARIASGKLRVPRALKRAVAEDYSPFHLDEATERIFVQGQGEALIEQWALEGGEGDFALDAFVPAEYHEPVADAFMRLGRMPVRLHWSRVGPLLLPPSRLDEQVNAFHGSIGLASAPKPAPVETKMKGYIDRLGFERGVLQVRGWAVGPEGGRVERLELRQSGTTCRAKTLEVQARPDVKKRLGLAVDHFGFLATFDVPNATRIQDLAPEFAIVVPGSGALPLTKKASDQVKRDGN